MFLTHAHKLFLVGLAALLLFGLSFSQTSVAQAANFTVNSLADNTIEDGACTLREAIINANDDAQTHADCAAGSGADTITFAFSLTSGGDATITLSSFDNGTDSDEVGAYALGITSEIVIDGGSSENGITIERDGGAAFRLFYVTPDGDLTLRGLTLAGGAAQGGNGGSGGGGAAGMGGAIFNRAGNVTIENSTFTGHSATGGEGSDAANGGGGGLGADGADGAAGDGGNPNGGLSGTDIAARNGGFGGGGAANSSIGFSVGGDGGFGGGGGGAAGGGNGGFGGGGGSGNVVLGGGAAGFGGGAGTVDGSGSGGGFGGAIFNNEGTITIRNSTFANNSANGGTDADGYGGAIFNRNGSLTVNNATFSDNSVTTSGGGIYSLGDGANAAQNDDPNSTGNPATATLALANSIVANSSGGDDVVVATNGGGTSNSSGVGNLVEAQSGFAGTVASSADPQLGALADNGGSTDTFALPEASPAIDLSDDATCEVADQRGVDRPLGFACDAGAFELEFDIVVTSSADNFTDDNQCTLAEAVANANDETDGQVYDDCQAGFQSGADTILFDPALTAGGDVTITLTNYDTGLDNGEAGPTAFNIFTDITILGAQGDNGITLARDENADEFRLFYVDGDDHNGVLTLRDLTLSGGVARGGDGASGGGGAAGFGGAILNRVGVVLLERVTIMDSSAIGGVGASGTGGGGGGLAGDGQADGTPGGPADDFGGGGSGTPAGLADPGGGGGSPNGSAGFGGGGGGGIVIGQFGGDGGYGGTDGGNNQGGNGGAFGGAIFNWGEFSSTQDGPAKTTLINSTVTGNSVEATGGASAFGSAIFSVHSEVTLIHTTVVSNTHTGDVTDGMVFVIGNANGTPNVLRLQNSIIAHGIGTDSALRTEQYVGGSARISADSGNNLIDSAEIDASSQRTLEEIASQEAPLLFPLADNGGPSLTFDVMFDSPARNAIAAVDCELATDQRGVARPIDGACEIGAVERDVTPVLTIEKTVDNAEPQPDDRVTFTIVVGNRGDGDATTPTTVTDLLPAELDFVAGSVTIDPSGTAGTPPNLATIPTIGAGESATITFQADATFDLIDRDTVITNVATASNADAPADVSDSVSLTLSAPPGTLVSRIGDVNEIDIDDLGAMEITLSLSDDESSIIVNDPDHPVIALDGATQIDNNTASIPFVTSPRQTFNILGSLGDDTLIFDHTNGLTIPNQSDVNYDGGPEDTADGDSFRSIGQNNTPAHDYTFISDSSGTIEYGGTTITYTGLEPVYVDTNTASLTLTLSDTVDFVTISDIGNDMANIDGATLETTDFGLPLGSAPMLVELGAGDDTLVMDSLVLDGKTRLTIDGEEGEDEVLWQMGRSSADTERIRISSADFTFDPSVSHSVILRGTGQGDTYDQIRMSDANTITLNIPLDLSLGDSFVPSPLDSFTLIEMEDAAGVVVGTFDGYPEGHAFTLDGVPFRITYTGGDGNDVVLFVPNLVVSTVSELQDTDYSIGQNSLRDAIAQAVDGDTITFADTISDGTITLSSPVVITKDITISGTVPITIDGDDSVRVFIIDDSSTVTIDQLNISDGRSNDGAEGSTIRVFSGSDLTLLGSNVSGGTNVNADGGGIAFESGASGTLRGVTFTDNSAAAGSGGAVSINSGATVEIINSTLSGNMAGQFGGAIVNNAGTLTMNNVTLAENDATLNGAALATSGGATTVNNTLFANSSGSNNCLLDATTGSANLSDDSSCNAIATQVSDVLLDALANHDEPTSTTLPTATYSLLPSSPALDAGASCEADDQRGIARPQLSACDIGAFESQGFTISDTGGSGQTTIVGAAFTNPLTLTLTANDNNALTEGGTIVFTAPTDGASIDTTPIAATVGANGAVSVNVTANDTVGSYDVTATTTDDSATYTLSNVTLNYSVDDVSVEEGDSGTTALNFVVRRNTNGIAGTVDFVTSDGCGTPPCRSAEAGSDYTAVTTTVSFTAGGSLTQTVTVDVAGDEIVEADEQLFATISNPSIGSIIDATAIGIIANDDTTFINFGGTVSGIESFNGGNRTYNYFVTSSREVQGGFTIDFSTNDDTATAGSDYEDNDDTLTFAGTAGEQQNFQVIVINDDVVEPNEDFVLLLDGPFDTTLGDSFIFSRKILTATIDDEDIATVTLSGGVAQPEGDAGTVTYEFTATLDEMVVGGFDVAYTTDDDSAVAGSDFIDNDGSLSFAGNIGETKKIFVDVTGDEVVEADETFTVSLGAFSNTVVTSALRSADTPQTATIENDDVATLSISDSPPVTETDSGIVPVPLTVTLNGDVQDGTSVTYATVSDTATLGTDFNGFGGQTLTFDGNDGETKTITVELLGDTRVEADESFNIEIREPTNGVTITRAAGLIPIINDDSATVMITGSPSADEGDLLDGTTPFEFTVSVSERVQGGFDIAYTTNDGTATAGSDYVDNDGTLSFPEFGTLPMTAAIEVDVNGDNTVEADEMFEVVLGEVSNIGNIDPNDIMVVVTSDIGTILNDDGVAFSVSDATVVEGDSGTVTMVFTVTADGEISTFASVDYATQDGTATAGSDYVADNDTLTFGSAGSQTVEITVNGDTFVEGDEAFSLILSNDTATIEQTQIADAEGIGTIVDDDAAQLAIGDATVVEGNSGTVTATFTVTLTGDVAGGTSVDFASADNTATAGSDYTANSGTLTFAGTDGETQTIAIVVNGDTTVEATETFSITLSAPTNGATITDGTAIGTIENDDSATVTLSGGTTKLEGDGGTVAYQFTATLDNAVDGGVMVAYTTDDGSASADSDYTDNDGMLTFAGTVGEQQTITVQVNGDTTVESDETFSVSLGAVSGALADAVSTAGSPQTGTITNDDTATVTLAGGTTQAEGDNGTTDYAFTVTLDNAVQGGVTVDFTTNDGTATVADGDYVDNDNTLSFAGTAGEVKTITVQVNGDMKVENNETFSVTLGATSKGSVTVAGTPQQGGISNDDTATVTLSGGTTQAEGDSGTTAFTFTATLDNAVDGGFDLAYTTDDGTATVADSDYADNDGTLTFTGTAGEEQTITVLVNGDTKTENDETFSVALGAFSNAAVSSGDLAADGTPQTSTIDNDDTTFVISDAEVLEGDSGTATLLFTVTLQGEAAGVTTVAFATQDGTATTADGDYNANSGMLLFTGASGETNTIAVQVNGDTKVEDNETLTVMLSNASGGVTIEDDTGDGTIFNDDGATLSIGDVTVNEADGTATIVVTMNTTNVNPVTVDFATLDGSATDPDDYTGKSDTITIAANETTGTATIDITNDSLDENDETFTVTLSNANGATIADGTGVVTIVDNDDAPAVSVSGETVSEAAGSLDFTITLDAVSGLDVMVEYATSDGSATAGSDYVAKSGTVTILAGETQATVSVMVTNDDVAEESETLNMTLSNPTNATLGTSSASSTITDDEVASVTITPNTASINEGSSEAFVVTLSAEPTSPVTITLVSQDTGECLPAVSSVVLDSSNWDTGVSFDVSGVQDNAADGDQSCTITVSMESDAAQFSSVDPDDLTVTIVDTSVPTAIALATQQAAQPVTIWQLLLTLLLAGATVTIWRKRMS